MYRVLLLGGKGYIGVNLEKYLLENDYKVICYDKYVNGFAGEDIKTLENYDRVIHLGATSGIKNCNENMNEAIINNISSPFNIFRLSSEEDVPVLFISSQAAKSPVANFYAMTKFITEVEAKRINHRITTFRLSNVYGGIDYLEKKNTVISKFIKAYKNGEPLNIDGDGSQRRDFIHVYDVCKFIERWIAIGTHINDILDIGTGIPISINELADMFKDAICKKTDNDPGISTNYVNPETAEKTLYVKADPNRLQNYINSCI